MKKQIKILIYFSTLIIVLMILSVKIPLNTVNNELNNGSFEDVTKDSEEIRVPKQATFWNLPYTIDINGNWSQTASWYDWCDGGGFANNPYVIENVTIDAGGSRYAIRIQSTTAYFTIRNCTLYNATTNNGRAIDTFGVSNGYIYNNTFKNNYAGIDIPIGNNINITHNRIINTTSGAIFLVGTPTNFNISKNEFYNCRFGIYSADGPQHDENYIISDNMFINCTYGITLQQDINNCNVSGNEMYDTDIGIDLDYSYDITLKNNLMNECGLNLEGLIDNASSHDIDTSNLVNGKPIYYHVNKIALKPNNVLMAGQVILVNCNDSVISNIDVSRGTKGITLLYSHNNTISNINSSYNSRDGIYLRYSNNNTISKNNASHNEYNKAAMVLSAGHGIYTLLCYGSNISENIVKNNYYGIAVLRSLNTTIFGNQIIENDRMGLILNSDFNMEISNKTLIYNNTFVGNTINTMDNGTNNQWTKGTLGNYWDDYEGVDANNDGIGDTPYDIPGTAGSHDYYPIWNDWTYEYMMAFTEAMAEAMARAAAEAIARAILEALERAAEEGEIPPEVTAIPGYELAVLIGVTGISSVILLKKRKKI